MQKLKEVFKIFHDKKGKSFINILAIIFGISFYLFTIINFKLNLYSDLYDYLIFLEIPIILILISNLRSTSKKEIRKNKYFMLFIYLIFLISLIIINPIKGLVLNGVKLYDYNLIPFKTIISSFHDNLDTLTGHFLMLMPFSILLPLINKNFKKHYVMLLTLILTSLTFRGLEYLLLVGVFDIDEVILNVIGGYLLFLLIYKTSLIELLKKYFTFKIKDKTLNIISIILFIMLIFLGSNRVFAYIYQENGRVPEVSGSIKCLDEETLVGVIDGYKYYTNCQGNYNVVFDNTKYTLEDFINNYSNIDKYMDKFKLRREMYLNDVLVNDNPLASKQLILKTPYSNIYYYNIESIIVKVGDMEYDFKDYLNNHEDISEYLNLDYTFKNKEKFNSIKDNYTIYVGEYFNKLICNENTYLLPKNYKVRDNTCNSLNKIKNED